MNKIWQLSIDEYIEIVEISKELGLQPGDDMTQVVEAYMNMKGTKPIGHTELTKEEFLKEAISKNNNILNFEVDKEGKAKYSLFKKKVEENNG